MEDATPTPPDDAKQADTAGPGQLISEEIGVERQGLTPVAFTWRGERHEIAEVLRMWFDVKFGPTASRIRKGWWERRHRTYYRVRTSGGERFDLYWDRGSIGRRWFVYRRLRPDAGRTGGGEE